MMIFLAEQMSTACIVRILSFETDMLGSSICPVPAQKCSLEALTRGLGEIEDAQDNLSLCSPIPSPGCEKH